MEMELKKEKVVKKLVNIKLNSCRFNNWKLFEADKTPVGQCRLSNVFIPGLSTANSYRVWNDNTQMKGHPLRLYTGICSKLGIWH